MVVARYVAVLNLFVMIRISITWYANKRTLVFNGVLGSLVKNLITDLLKNDLPRETAISNADANNCSSETNYVDQDVNGAPSIDGHNPIDQSNIALAESVEDPKLPKCIIIVITAVISFMNSKLLKHKSLAYINK